MAKALTVYYNEDEVDLKGLIQQLAVNPDGPYYQRSHSAIAKLLLIQALREKLGDKLVKPESGENIYPFSATGRPRNLDFQP